MLSATRLSAKVTPRTSPDSPSSPKAVIFLSIAIFLEELANDRATAKSIDGSRLSKRLD